MILAKIPAVYNPEFLLIKSSLFQKLHDLKKRGPTACSLFLDQIMKSGSGNFNFGGESCCDTSDLRRHRGGLFSHSNNPNWNEVLKAKMTIGGGKSDEERVLSNVRLSQARRLTFESGGLLGRFTKKCSKT